MRPVKLEGSALLLSLKLPSDLATELGGDVVHLLEADCAVVYGPQEPFVHLFAKQVLHLLFVIHPLVAQSQLFVEQRSAASVALISLQSKEYFVCISGIISSNIMAKLIFHKKA